MSDARTALGLPEDLPDGPAAVAVILDYLATGGSCDAVDFKDMALGIAAGPGYSCPVCQEGPCDCGLADFWPALKVSTS